MIWEKYFEAFNFYFAKPINEILLGVVTPQTILFKDFQYYDEEKECLKRYYITAEFKGKLEALSEHYSQESERPKPNLSVHDQNKIILKRNLLLHKLYVSKLPSNKDMPQTACGQSPWLKRKERELISMDEETEGMEQEAVRGKESAVRIDKQEMVGEHGSYETKFYDIYNPGDSSVFLVKVESKILVADDFEQQPEELKKFLTEELEGVSQGRIMPESRKFEESVTLSSSLGRIDQVNVKGDEGDESDFMMIQQLTTEEQSPVSIKGRAEGNQADAMENQETVIESRNTKLDHARLSLKLEALKETAMEGLPHNESNGKESEDEGIQEQKEMNEKEQELLSEVPLSARNKDNIFLPPRHKQFAKPVFIKPSSLRFNQKPLEQKQETEGNLFKKEELPLHKAKLKYKGISSLTSWSKINQKMGTQNDPNKQDLNEGCQSQPSPQNTLAQRFPQPKPNSPLLEGRTRPKGEPLVGRSSYLVTGVTGSSDNTTQHETVSKQIRFSLDFTKKTSNGEKESLTGPNNVYGLATFASPSSSQRKPRKPYKTMQPDTARSKDSSRDSLVSPRKLSLKTSTSNKLHSPSKESLHVIRNRKSLVEAKREEYNKEAMNQNKQTSPIYRYTHALLLSPANSVGSVKSTSSNKIPENSSKNRVKQLVFPNTDYNNDSNQLIYARSPSIQNDLTFEKPRSFKSHKSAKGSEIHLSLSLSQSQGFASSQIQEALIHHPIAFNSVNIKLNLKSIQQNQSLQTRSKDLKGFFSDRASDPNIGSTYTTLAPHHLGSREDEYFVNLSPRKPQSSRKTEYYRSKKFIKNSQNAYFGANTQNEIDPRASDNSLRSFNPLKSPRSARSTTEDDQNQLVYNFNQKKYIKMPKLLKQNSDSRK